MKAYMYGFILNVQFLSMIPFPFEVPINKTNIKRAVQTFPVFGLFQGVIYTSVIYFFIEYTPLSSLAVAFSLWLLLIVLTGGIHLDGWIDCSDAYFSYRDKEKRLRIMEDSRVGAFGVLSLVVLLAMRFFLIYEVILMITPVTYFFILIIPFFSKTLMGMMLIQFPLAKEKGMAHFYSKATETKSLWVYLLYFSMLLVAVIIWLPQIIIYFLVLPLTVLLLLFVLRRKILAWFGGITGDVTGASGEGVELFLWIIVWLFHYYGMG